MLFAFRALLSYHASFCRVLWSPPKHKLKCTTQRSIYVNRQTRKMRHWKKKDGFNTWWNNTGYESRCAQARWEITLRIKLVMRREGNCGIWASAISGLASAECELDVIYTGPTSGSRRKHYFPPESYPSHVAVGVGFHIKMDPLLL